MKLTIKQLSFLKNYIKEENGLKGVYSSVNNLWYNDYFNCWNFEFQAVDFKDNKYNDLMRFTTDELNEIINK